MGAWRALILAYCRHHRTFTLDLTESLESPLFNNADIQRRLSEESIQAILDELAVTGHVEWTDKAKKEVLRVLADAVRVGPAHLRLGD